MRRATPHRALAYDKNKDMHYDVISAFIKSMRGSDPDAALYWLARMIDGGEDPKFIARRMMIQASEDVGNADPQAFLIAEAAFKSAEVIGYPECRINLAQAAIYLALAPKSNAAEAGIDAALAEVRHGPARKVPDYLRDRHRPGSENYGTYKYPDYPEGWVEQRYLPDGLERGCFYHPSEAGLGSLPRGCRRPHRATGGASAARRTALRQVIAPRRKAAPRQAIPREGRSATRPLLLLKGSPPPRTRRFRTSPPKRHIRQTPLPPPAKPASSDCSKAAAITARALDGDVASRAIIGCWIIR